METLRLHVVYDGGCRFCSALARVLRRLDLQDVLRLHDAREREAVVARLPVLRDADLDAALFVVEEGGAAFRGFFAVRRLAWSMPALWLLLPVLYAPGARRLGPRVYAWVARNRRCLGCRTDAEDRGGER
ncbi:MAG: thiol-disulfide oxidoreductase DCC family protein [Candidatus Methylomirabilales bacterium]